MALATIRHIVRDWRSGGPARAIERGLLFALVTHVRHGPKPYTLSHKLWYFHVGLDDLDRLPAGLSGHNRGVYSLNDRDYGTSSKPLATWLAAALNEGGCPLPDGRILLLSLPRTLVFNFNPVSFWLCHDNTGALRSVLAEVNNTYGERHCYVCRKDDGSPITAHDGIVARKVFHVSPFLPVAGHYVFRFAEQGDRIGIFINLFHGAERVLFVSISGRLQALTARTLLGCLLRTPIPSVRVMALIHYHAAQLWLLGIKPLAKPPPPADFVSSSYTVPEPAKDR